MKRELGMMTGLLLLAACESKYRQNVEQAKNVPGVAGALGQKAFVIPSTTFSEHSFTPIPADPPKCEGVAGAEVTWTLSDVLFDLDTKNRIKRNIMRGSVVVDGIPANEVAKNWPTNLDMDIGSAGSDYVMVKIVLKTGEKPNKPGVHFLRPRSGGLPTGPNPGGTDSSVAVLTPAGQPGNIEYCGRTPIDLSVAGEESFRFGVRKAAGVRSLNIGLMVPTVKEKDDKSQMWLPIFLDPNVRNEG
jgi:hypothetical protein